MENITFASFIERSARSRTRFDRGVAIGSSLPEIPPMGTRLRSLGWVPYQGLGTPSFCRPPSRDGNAIGHAPGERGPASLNRG
jgi:hypothetical protein